MDATKKPFISLVIALTMLSVTAVPVQAVYQHSYSNGNELSLGWGYTGGKVTRNVQSGVILASCSNPAFDTMWIKLASSYAELATSYYCDGIWTQAGFGLSDGTWTRVWHSQTIGTSIGQHTFKLVQDVLTKEWVPVIDTYAYASIDPPDTGTAHEVDALWETYDDATYAPAHGLFDLKYERLSSGTFVSWSGQDDKDVDNPPNCGRFITDISFRVAENDSCS